jgi:hypothetical protein
VDYPPSVLFFIFFSWAVAEVGVESELFSVERGAHGLLEFALDPTSEVGRATTKAYVEALGFIDRVFGRDVGAEGAVKI